MRKILVLASTVLSFLATSQPARLTESAEISVMTLGPYQLELYSAFGHTAIRVYDPTIDLDLVYNYGVFDFNQKNFYLNFAKGKMIYKLGLTYYEPFRDFYISQNRDIREQVLNLSDEQTQAVYTFLKNNYKPANRDYLYNYVYENCASKIPDVLDAVLGEKLTYDSSYMADGKTIRGLMHDYLGAQPWGEWAIDIGLGAQIDKVADRKESMFLPDYVFNALALTTIQNDSTTLPLIRNTKLVYTSKDEESENGWLTPMNFFVLLFFIGGFITHRNMKSGKRTRWLDGLLFGFAGFVGLWLVFLWAATAHLSTWNYDLLWAIPFHFVIVFLMRFKKFKNFSIAYFKITGIVYGLLLLTWAILPEPINMALVPFTLLLLLRAFYISYNLKKVK
jgi:hypothetical protein